MKTKDGQIERKRMMLSEMPIGSTAKMGQIHFYRNGGDDYVLVVPGKDITKGESPMDVPVKSTTQEEFNTALDGAVVTSVIGSILFETFKR